MTHSPCPYPEWIPSNLVKLIPSTGYRCSKCEKRSVYLGYIDPDFRKYQKHFLHQLKYCRENSHCHCYWPEHSSQQEKISDMAYLCFRDLISTTALANLLKNEEEQRNFIDNPGWFLSKHGLTISFIAEQFRFSDYYHVCKDIEDYSLSKYSENNVAKIKDKLGNILESLYSNFFSLYSSCYKKHPSLDIERELEFMKLLSNDTPALKHVWEPLELSLSPLNDTNSIDLSELIISNLQIVEIPEGLEKKGSIKMEASIESSQILSDFITNNYGITNLNEKQKGFSLESEILLEQGTILNSLMLYKNAIQVLSEAIKMNFSNRNAYIERALAYFETNQIKLALKDYEKIQHLTIPPFKSEFALFSKEIYIPKHKIEFSKGLIKGTLKGLKDAGEELIPSILSSCRGILYGLWAFATNPSQVTEELIQTAYAIGEYINSHDFRECLECVVPELKDLSFTWHTIDDHTKGKKIGYIIGKYGIEVFAPIGIFKGIAKYKALKRCNTLLTLERCAESQSARKIILEKSAEFAVKRETIVQEAIKNGKILVRNANDKIHIMQKKHAWDKIVTTLSGNVGEDCLKVINLLEENQIFLEKYQQTAQQLENNFLRLGHEMTINGFKVKAVFIKNSGNGEILLTNAWVVTK